jgi:hypothetical protein
MCCPALPAGDQPPIGPGPLELSVAQPLRDRVEGFRERGRAAAEAQRDLAVKRGVDIGGPERGDPRDRLAEEEQHAPGGPVARIELGIVQQSALSR